MDYREFLASKHVRATDHGFTVDAADIHAALYPWQSDIVRWALAKGRAALFEECGLGKTIQQLEWARHVARHSGGRVLIVCPLAVAGQTCREGQLIGLAVEYHRSQASADASTASVIVTNYDMVESFDPAQWAGVVLDESSILKSFSGRTKTDLVDRFSQTEYRLACSATPAPNDHMELGNHAEFLGVMRSNEMLSRWFINDTMNFGTYRLKGHAESDFWRWLTSWAVCIGKPSDLVGHSEGDYILPSLELVEHKTEADLQRAHDRGQLFQMGGINATNLWGEKSATLTSRIAAVSRIMAAVPDTESVIVWCNTNEEADALRLAIPEAVEVRGSDTHAVKESKLESFTNGDKRVIITKPGIAGYGLNWQHAGTQVFAGVTYSFEDLYQAIRRSLRYGRVDPVTVHLIYAESESGVLDAIARKRDDFTRMQSRMIEAMRTHGLFRDTNREELTMPERDDATGTGWRMMLGDCCDRINDIPSDSIPLSVFSPPFSNLYIYSDSVADMGNAVDDAEFLAHYAYLARELLRVTVPGRLCAIHVKDLPRYGTTHGASGLYDLPGEVTRIMEGEGWQYHSKVTIWKDPVIEMQRTKSYGLLHKSFEDRAEVCRQGMPDYVIVFRKHAADMNVGQVKQHREPGDYIGDNPPGPARSRREYSIQLWQRYASPVWFDINQTNVLNGRIAREGQDEKHICPLQLDVIARIIDLWSLPGETVLSPFAGIGSEGYQAIKQGREFIGIELKRAYWEWAIKHLELANRESAQIDMFAVAGIEVPA